MHRYTHAMLTDQPTQTEEVLQSAAERAARYFAEANHRPVAPTQQAVDRLDQLPQELPIDGMEPMRILEMLDSIGSPATTTSAGGRYFGFVIGGSLPVTLGARWLADAWDQNAGLRVISPIAAELEETVLRWLAEFLELPSNGGGFVTGASMANFSALAAARHALLERQGWDVENDGLFGAPELQVVVSDDAHSSIYKGLQMLGLGRNRVVRVPTDDQGRMIASQVPPLGPNSIVCVQAGNVDGGSFDPIQEIGQAAKDAGAWFHVDGAFGLWARAVPELQHLAQGCELADSWAVDAHKWLNVPYDCGVVMVRDENTLRQAMSFSAPYLPPGSRREPCHYTPELSRRSRGVEPWAAFLALGKNGLVDLIRQSCQQARRFGEGLREAGFDVMNDVVLNQVLVSFGDDAKTHQVIQAIQEEGTCWMSGTTRKGRAAMRISVSSWRTTDDDVEQSLQAILRCARNG